MPLDRFTETPESLKQLTALARNLGKGQKSRDPVDRIRSCAYFSPSWTAFQADRGRDFSVIVDGISN